MKKYTLEEIKAAMKNEGIGNSSTSYVIDRLNSLNKEDESQTVAIDKVKGQIKEKPYFSGNIRVNPQSNNNVHFKHNNEECQLHFLTNGNIAFSKESNKSKFIELNANQVFENILKNL